MIHLPVSKSIAARFLVASYFGGTLPADPAFNDCDDLIVLQQALLTLYADEEPIDYGESPLDVHASGTAMRFVTAVCASTPDADFVVTGTPRICARPMQPLIEVLEKAGAVIQPQGPNGQGPYRVTGKQLEGGEFSIRGDVSSQFISALMLCAPAWTKGMNLLFTTPPVSFPYIEMTAKVMQLLGVKTDLTTKGVKVNHGDYNAPEDFKVEADWSAAAFFYEGAFLSGKPVAIENLCPPEKSLQGDSRAAALFRQLGVESDFSSKGVDIKPSSVKAGRLEADFSGNPDLVPSMAVACALGGIEFRFTGVATLRIKECDRLDALKKELGKLGFEITIGDNTMEWNGKTDRFRQSLIRGAEDFSGHAEWVTPLIATYDDHRIAMAFAMSAFRYGEIRIENPDCVAKSFIGFWEELPKIGLSCKKEGNVMTVKLLS